MTILFLIEVFIVGFALFLLGVCIFDLKRIPKGILEWLIWIAAIAILISWRLGYAPISI